MYKYSGRVCVYCPGIGSNTYLSYR